MIRRKWVVPSLIASGVLVIVAGGAVAAVETDIVMSFPRGIWWSLSLMTTVGLLGASPTTTPGAILSFALVVGGFFLLAWSSPHWPPCSSVRTRSPRRLERTRHCAAC